MNFQTMQDEIAYKLQEILVMINNGSPEEQQYFTPLKKDATKHLSDIQKALEQERLRS